MGIGRSGGAIHSKGKHLRTARHRLDVHPRVFPVAELQISALGCGGLGKHRHAASGKRAPRALRGPSVHFSNGAANTNCGSFVRARGTRTADDARRRTFKTSRAVPAAASRAAKPVARALPCETSDAPFHFYEILRYTMTGWATQSLWGARLAALHSSRGSLNGS